MTEYWSYVLAPFGLIGLWMSGSRNRWGWALSIGTQVLWLTYAVQTEQWGFIPGSLAYGLIYARNFIRWSDKPTGPTVEELLQLLDLIAEDGRCQLDHNGNCQEHSWFDWGEGPGCADRRAHRILITAGVRK